MSQPLYRHNLLWEGSRMFLPEHRAALLAQQDNAQAFVPPELDDDRWQEINRLVLDGLDGDFPLLIRYVHNKRPCACAGFIQTVNVHEKWLRLANGSHMITIPFARIYDAEKL